MVFGVCHISIFLNLNKSNGKIDPYKIASLIYEQQFLRERERERESKWCECLCVSGSGTDVMEMISTNHLPSESAAYPMYQSGFWSRVLNAFIWKSTL